MVCIKGDCILIFCNNLHGDRLAIHSLQINLRTDREFLCSGKLGKADGEDRLWVCFAIGFRRHQMYLPGFSDLHVSNSQIIARNHHPGAANEFKRLAPIIRGVELCPVMKGSSIMGPNLFTDVFTFG